MRTHILPGPSESAGVVPPVFSKLSLSEAQKLVACWFVARWFVAGICYNQTGAIGHTTPTKKLPTGGYCVMCQGAVPHTERCMYVSRCPVPKTFLRRSFCEKTSSAWACMRMQCIRVQRLQQAACTHLPGSGCQPHHCSPPSGPSSTEATWPPDACQIYMMCLSGATAPAQMYSPSLDTSAQHHLKASTWSLHSVHALLMMAPACGTCFESGEACTHAFLFHGIHKHASGPCAQRVLWRMCSDPV